MSVRISLSPGVIGWLTLAAGIIVYDSTCPKGETLSEQMDRWLAHRSGRFIAWAVGGIVFSHVFNILPPDLDPIHRLSSLKT